ncbi:MAG: IS200/IS605 family transposase [Prolixibacteraceae bacterium]|jgi:putative transposase|nr:IS200/IS605 family transposase [Prolixibacteraceae bacterium]
MANTYTQLNVHIVFAVKGRANILTSNFRNTLFEYITGILKNLEQYPLSVNGYKDHVHCFFELNPNSSVADIAGKVKANSSKWINKNKFVLGHFEWQRGYGGFTYSKSQRNTVINYIKNQEQHHSTKSFKEEYFELLKKFEIEFENKYIFEFYE